MSALLRNLLDRITGAHSRRAKIEHLNRQISALEAQVKNCLDIISRHRLLIADARVLLHNNGYGPNASQTQHINRILLEIAFGPQSPPEPE